MTTERHKALDLIRGLAALAIATYHWLSWNEGIEILSIGAFGVYVFFALSSLTMMYAYGGVFADHIERSHLITFFRNRMARLLPLLLVVAVAAAPLELREHGWSMATMLKTVLTGSGLFALTPPGFTASATATWSLGVELQFYAVVPLAILYVSRAPIGQLWLAFAGLIVGQQAYLLLVAGATPALEWHYYVAPITFAPFFMAGFLIFQLGGDRFALALPLSLLALAGLVAFSVVWPGPVRAAGAPFLILTALAIAAVYFANRASVPTTLARTAVLVGDLSYAVYLTHPFTNIATNVATRMIGIEGYWRLIVFLVATLSIALIVHKYFEVPMKNRLRGGRGNPSPATLP